MNPLTLYQQCIDRVSRAAMEGDFDAYAAMIDLPYLVRTASGDNVLATRADLIPGFRVVHDGLVRRGVTHYERVARDAEYLSNTRIRGRHFTHLIAAGMRVTAPWPASHTLVRRGDDWLFSEAYYPAFSDDWPPSDDTVFMGLPGTAEAHAATEAGTERPIG